MNPPRRSFLSFMDDALRWTGMPARVAKDMSATSERDRPRRPLRWSPIWLMAFACALFLLSLAWRSPPLLAMLTPSLGAMLIILLPMIHSRGPLGKPSIEDDEREAALRKESFLFCLGVLAFLNCLGQPVLMILSHLQHWQIVRSMQIAVSGLTLNAVLFGCLPTLYASWQLPRLPQE